MTDEPITKTAGPDGDDAAETHPPGARDAPPADLAPTGPNADDAPDGLGTLTATASPRLPRSAAIPGGGSGAPITAPPPPDADGLPPSLHARFEDFQLLGRGGMGAVYRARDLRLGRTVAVKVLFRESAGGGLLKEARSQARLVHPNVCEVYEAGVADGSPFIVMRYVDGQPLSRMRREMSLEEKVSAVRDAALGLHEAHRAGLIHRDVKPSNLMVERGEDGRCRTFVCDFGIARDVADTSVTVSEAVHGTPAYMSPEQAQGKARSLDRRSDVYGLGATLYDAIAEAPPISAGSIVEMLRAVIEVEPRPLRAAAPEVPVDLEAIVMKCLEKDPGGRYESAKALAEDLQRFLDGDPVRARPTSWGARLLRRAKKHRGKVALGAAAVLAGLTLGGLWIRDRRLAGERAQIAREMGGAVREMELFLRGAESLPLHDVERERDVVRARLGDIESRLATSGEAFRGPAHDALGRGYLALRDPAKALAHLSAAKSAGEDAPGLDYALGLARVALYREGLERADRIQKESDKKAAIEAVEKEHKAPAIEHLRAAVTRGVESPAYALGLLALTEGRFEEALSRAKEAFSAAPWLVEAKKLEGDALLEIANQTGHDKVYDAARTKEHQARAAEAYRAASDVARSDPSVYVAECALWGKAMYVAANDGGSMRPDFERARSACEKAIAASSRETAGTLQLALVYSTFAYWATTSHHADIGSPEVALQGAAKAMEEAVRARPEDAFPAYLEGSFWRSKAFYDGELGHDERASADRSIAAFERALALDPSFVWAMNEGCGVLAFRGRREWRLGQDTAPTYARALQLCRRALESDPTFAFPRGTMLFLFADDAEQKKDSGKSPADAIEAGMRVIADAEKKDPAWPWAPYYRAAFARIDMEYRLLSGADPGPALARERAAFEELAPRRESFEDTDVVEGELSFATALALLAKRGVGEVELSAKGAVARAALPAKAAPDPEVEQALSRGRAVYRKLTKAAPWDVEPAIWLARVELLEMRYRVALGADGAPFVEAALAAIRPFLATPRESPQLYALAARVHEVKAALSTDEKARAEEMEACRREGEKAVAVGPGFPGGRAVLERCRGAEEARPQVP